MATKLNIFSALPIDHSDDEDHGKGQGKNAKKPVNKKEGGHKDAKPNNQPIKQSNEDPKKAHKDDHKKSKQTPESGHHASDRHSGTGHAAFDKKTFKKGGHGKGNVGKADDKEENAKEEEVEEAQEKEEEPKGISLEEYWAKKGIKTESTNQVDPAIKKKMEEELTKELLAKKATPLVSRRKAEEKEVKQEASHFVALNSNHSDLLNFRTGFVEREYKERKEGERPAPRERKEYPKKEEKNGENQEGEKTEKVEEGEESPEDKKEGAPRKQYSKGGYKGNKQGGNRSYNNQKGGSGQGQPKIDLGDDAFPKLG
jgi:hypothetical protein